MCDNCGKRKADVALFLGEHAPQLGIRSERAQVAWSELNAIAIELTKLPDEATREQFHAAHEDQSRRMTKILEGLSLSELEEIFFASGTVWMTGSLHRNGASAMMKVKWRAGERDSKLAPEAAASIESAIAQDDANDNLRKGLASVIAQAFGADAPAPPAPSVSVFVPGNGKPVPPS